MSWLSADIKQGINETVCKSLDLSSQKESLFFFFLLKCYNPSTAEKNFRQAHTANTSISLYQRQELVQIISAFWLIISAFYTLNPTALTQNKPIVL